MKAKSNRKLQAYLFNDLLLFLHSQRGKFTVYRQPIPLNEILVRDCSAVKSTDESQICSFEIVHIEKIIRLKANSLMEKRKWMNLLDEHSRASRIEEDRDYSKEEYLGTLRVFVIEGKYLSPVLQNGKIF